MTDRLRETAPAISRTPAEDSCACTKTHKERENVCAVLLQETVTVTTLKRNIFR